MDAAPPQLLPEELIVEILSRVPVKALMRFRCVSQAWNSLIFDPTFIKSHLQLSSKNTHVLVTFVKRINPNGGVGHGSTRQGAALCSISNLLDNPSSTINDCYHHFNINQFVCGACNGLVCFFDFSDFGCELIEYWVQFWNPATKVMSQVSPRLRLNSSDYINYSYFVKCGFGFDDSCNTYKVVAILLDRKLQEREVRVHCMGDTCWRKILTFPVFPILGGPDGKFAGGTLNWLACQVLFIHGMLLLLIS